MKKYSLAAVAVVMLTLSLVGCASDEPEAVADQAMQETVVLWGDMADAFEGVTDKASADALATRIENEFVPRLDRIVERLSELRESMSEEAFKALGEEVGETMMAKYEEPMEEAMERFGKQMMRVGMTPGLMTEALQEAMASFETAGNRMAEVMDDY